MTGADDEISLPPRRSEEIGAPFVELSDVPLIMGPLPARHPSHACLMSNVQGL